MNRSVCALLGGCFAVGLAACSSDSSGPAENAVDASGSAMSMPEGGAAGTMSSVANDSATSMEAARTEAASTLPLDAAALGDVLGQGDGGTRSKKAYLCNVVMGDSVTYDWYTGGFENGVDGSRWEAMAPTQSGLSFIQLWNDPQNQLWTMAKISPCTQHADTPDRAIFLGVNWVYRPGAEWVTQLDAIELGDPLRGRRVDPVDAQEDGAVGRVRVLGAGRDLGHGPELVLRIVPELDERQPRLGRSHRLPAAPIDPVLEAARVPVVGHRVAHHDVAQIGLLGARASIALTQDIAQGGGVERKRGSRLRSSGLHRCRRIVRDRAHGAGCPALGHRHRRAARVNRVLCRARGVG